MPAIANELQQALVVAIGDTELLTSFDFCPDLTHFESIEGHLSFEDLPEERAICKHIHLLIVLALLEKFGSHIARCASKLHGSSTQISLENISELSYWFIRSKNERTYNESCEAKVANLNVLVVVNENILTFDIAMNDSQVVHVKVDAGTVKSNFDT